MKSYSLAFIFTPDLEHVLLIHKVSPEWQKGKINGIGGKVEEGESVLKSIVREVFEETSLTIPEMEWKRVGVMKEEGGVITVFTAVFTGRVSDAKRNDKEEVEWFQVSSLPENVISNLRWLIPLSLDVLKHQMPKLFEAEY